MNESYQSNDLFQKNNSKQVLLFMFENIRKLHFSPQQQQNIQLFLLQYVKLPIIRIYEVTICLQLQYFYSEMLAVYDSII